MSKQEKKTSSKLRNFEGVPFNLEASDLVLPQKMGLLHNDTPIMQKYSRDADYGGAGVEISSRNPTPKTTSS